MLIIRHAHADSSIEIFQYCDKRFSLARGGQLHDPLIRPGYAPANSLSMAAITSGSVGSTAEGNVDLSWPSRPMRYLWKFQRGASRGRSAAAHLKNGWASFPFTATFSVIGKVTWYV